MFSSGAYTPPVTIQLIFLYHMWNKSVALYLCQGHRFVLMRLERTEAVYMDKAAKWYIKEYAGSLQWILVRFLPCQLQSLLATDVLLDTPPLPRTLCCFLCSFVGEIVGLATVSWTKGAATLQLIQKRISNLRLVDKRMPPDRWGMPKNLYTLSFPSVEMKAERYLEE